MLVHIIEKGLASHQPPYQTETGKLIAWSEFHPVSLVDRINALDH